MSFSPEESLLGTTRKDQGVAKAIALKAYLVVRQAAAHEHSTMRANAERAVQFLAGDGTADGLRRRVFYNLVLAELLRDTDPTSHRAAALDNGERLAALGYADPAPIYMRIFEATTERLRIADFGGLKSSPIWSHSR